MDADRPRDDGDRLGFGEVAEKLAQALGEMDLSQGFVVAVEGRWGSGKSSLVKMARKHLDPRTGPVWIGFSPWLVGNRDDLLGELFSQLGHKIDDVAPNTKKESTSRLLKRFASAARGAAFLAELSDGTSMPILAPISKLLRSLGTSADKLAETSLAELKE